MCEHSNNNGPRQKKKFIIHNINTKKGSSNVKSESSQPKYRNTHTNTNTWSDSKILQNCVHFFRSSFVRCSSSGSCALLLLVLLLSLIIWYFMARHRRGLDLGYLSFVIVKCPISMLFTLASVANQWSQWCILAILIEDITKINQIDTNTIQHGHWFILRKISGYAPPFSHALSSMLIYCYLWGLIIWNDDGFSLCSLLESLLNAKLFTIFSTFEISFIILVAENVFSFHWGTL